jgi:FSR family fosmidomycin resistance protein-like MFS transporter
MSSTTATAPPTPVPAHAAPRVSASRLRLVAATASHAVVDFFSFVIIPLMTVLKGKVNLSDADAALLIALGGVTSGFIQPGVAWLSDRYDTRFLGTLGVLVAVVAVGLVGYAQSYPVLMLLTVLSAAGIGAFHPVAAAAVGHLSGTQRSFGLSVFYCAGMAGGVAGNILSPLYVKSFGHGVAVEGLPALAWLIVPGLFCVAVLAWAIHTVAHRHEHAHASHAALPAHERRRRWRAVGLLYATNVLRFGVDSAIVALVIRWTESLALAKLHTPALTEAARTAAAQMNGPLQAAKQIGMGAGSLAIGWLIRRGGARERRAMILVPLLGAAAIPVLPFTGPSLGFFVMILAGLGYGSMVAPTIAMAQRLLPHRTGLASGLMMGGAWAVGAVLAPLANAGVDTLGLPWTFAAVGAICALSSLLAATLPRA